MQLSIVPENFSYKTTGDKIGEYIQKSFDTNNALTDSNKIKTVLDSNLGNFCPNKINTVKIYLQPSLPGVESSVFFIWNFKHTKTFTLKFKSKMSSFHPSAVQCTCSYGAFICT
jgi:hypothetical protein